jgi:hypothetical protein
MNDEHVDWLNRPVEEMSDFDVKGLVEDSETSVHIVSESETVLAPPADTVSTSRVRARSVGGYDPMIELSFKTTFLITEDTIPDDDSTDDGDSDDDNGATNATSPDWGLSDSVSDDNTSKVD